MRKFRLVNELAEKKGDPRPTMKPMETAPYLCIQWMHFAEIFRVIPVIRWIVRGTPQAYPSLGGLVSPLPEVSSATKDGVKWNARTSLPGPLLDAISGNG